MGNSLIDYRISIGLYNNVNCFKSCRRGLVVSIQLSTILCLLFIVSLSILLSGDVHLNPGPVKLKSLSLCHVNIRGLSIGVIQTTLCSRYDIITLSETFLGPQSTRDLTLPGYHPILRRDRPTFGGGIAIFIRENIAFKRKICLECKHIEQLWIEIATSYEKLLICCTYRPPNYADFWDHFDENLELVKSNSNVKNVVILGDINADLCTPNGRKLLELCQIHDLHCHVNEPTRITSQSSACLDQIITNIPNFVTSVQVDCPLSTNDHCTVGIDLAFKVILDPCYYRQIWLYEQGDYEGFSEALISADWESCFEDDDVDLTCRRWTELFLNTARAYIPNKTILVRPRDSPWYNCNLRKMKRKLVRLYHKAKERNSTYNWSKYKAFRSEYHRSLTDAQQNYYTNLCKSFTRCRDSKTWWSTVKHLLGKGKCQTYPPIYDEVNRRYALLF